MDNSLRTLRYSLRSLRLQAFLRKERNYSEQFDETKILKIIFGTQRVYCSMSIGCVIDRPAARIVQKYAPAGKEGM